MESSDKQDGAAQRAPRVENHAPKVEPPAPLLMRPIFWAGIVVLAGTAFLLVRYPKMQERRIANSLVWAAVEHQRAGRVEAAEALYKQALQLDAGSSLATYDLGCVAKERKAWEVAEFWFGEAIRLDPSMQAAKTDLATIQPQVAQSTDIEHAELMKAGLQAFFEDHSPERAIAIFRTVLRKNPEHYGATFQLARALDAVGKKAEAQPLWKKALAMAEALGDTQTAEWAKAQIK